MKHGLTQIDLNLRAQLALEGFSTDPERDIAALIGSPQPIEQRTREMLAAALLGKSGSIHLSATKRSTLKLFKAFELRRERLRIGRALNSGKSAPGGEDQVVIQSSSGRQRLTVSKSSADVCAALARKIDAWIPKIRRENRSASHLSDETLEILYLLADATGRLPDTVIKPSAELLPALLAIWDEIQTDAGKPLPP